MIQQTTQKMWFFLIFIAIACDQFAHSGYIYDKGLGSECLYDEDCITRHSFCKGNKICACKIGYQYDPGSDVCFAKVVDLKCTEDYDCSGIQNSRCDRGMCKCKPDHVPSKDKTACLPTMRLTSICEEDLQCNSVLNGSHCDPVGRHCICERGYHQDMYRMMCVNKQKLHTNCITNEDCESGVEDKGVIVCKQHILRMTCECADGYEEKNDDCVKAGSSQNVLSLTAFASLLVTFKFLL